MKSKVLVTVCAVLCLASLILLMACQRRSTTGAGGAWEPTRRVEWNLTVNPGGGNDIFTRNIIEIMRTNGISNADFVVNYQTDGQGEVARMRVARAGADAHTLLGFTSGELGQMLHAGNTTMDNFTPLAILAADKHILLVHPNSRYQSIEDILQGVREGRNISLGGAKGEDEVILFEMMCDVLGIPRDAIPFIGYISNADAITATLGGHIDLLYSKLLASEAFMISGDLVPIVIFSLNSINVPPFDTVPTLGELGWTSIENPIWRSILGSPDMPQEAVDYYIRIFREMSETPEWAAYHASNHSIPMSYFGEEARRYILDFQRTMGF